MKLRLKPLAIMTASLLTPFQVESAIKIPEGFEELAEGQIVMTEVFLYGQTLGLFQSRVDLEKLDFLQPELVASAIYKVLPDTPELNTLLGEGLKQSFPRNSKYSCGSNGNAPGCDFLKTNSIEIIYDENNSIVYLYLPDRFLQHKAPETEYYEQSVESRNALVHQQNINFVTNNNYQSASIQGNGSVGVTDNGYLNIDWTWLGQRFRFGNAYRTDIHNAYFRQDLLKRYYLQAGIMDARDIFSNAGGNINLSQLPLSGIHGFRMGSTLAWMNMNKQSIGTPLNVFLSRDSRVDAYRNDQLLASFYLKAGVQELDTRSFPSGSYSVTLEVYEDNKLVRTESLPYTGSGQAKVKSTQWFIQAGTSTKKQYKKESHDSYVIHAGIKMPFTNNTSATAGLASFSRAGFLEGAIDWTYGFNFGLIDGQMTLRTSYLYGNEGSRGNVQQLNYNDGFSLSLYHTSMSASDCRVQNNYRYSFNGCHQSSNVLFSVPFSQWYGTLGYSLTKNEGRFVYRNELTNIYWGDNDILPLERVYQTYSRSQTWQGGISRSFNFNNLNMSSSINAFMRNDSGIVKRDKGIFITFSMAQSHVTQGGKRSTASAGIEWKNEKSKRNQINYHAGYSLYTDLSGKNEIGGTLNGLNTDNITSTFYGRTDGQYGSGSVTVNDAWLRTTHKHALSSSGNYSSSLVIDRSGFSFGRWGGGGPASAIIVGVEQDDGESNTLVNVSLGTGANSDIHGQTRALFTLPGYQETAFKVGESLSIPDGVSSEISKGTGKKKVFMTPGKSINRKVQVRTRYTWLGRLNDDKHQPLEGGIPLNVISWEPLGEGRFALETSKRLKNLYVMKDNAFWQCRMKVLSIRDVVRYVGTSQCKATEFAALPGRERKQVELMTARMRQKMEQTVMTEKKDL
ncbi:TcfC E-set like domain-containing protein [Enterobacter roggenkampii]|uniref:TcfC E-set like domain-containing protein n=1 Tax=Enterobacter roggenkampii TaxID=1812935 RepID=UPI002DB866AC|nr:TcfC E-set like domain-containing protein [Enterobacter roggenkampii]MEB6513681.1 TcfC E-set like domain-containing protein [Enterobacter roggenkampii]